MDISLVPRWLRLVRSPISADGEDLLFAAPFRFVHCFVGQAEQVV